MGGRRAARVTGRRFAEMLGTDQEAGKSEDRGRRTPTPEADMQRHHRALAETDQRQFRIVEPKPLEFGVQKGVDRAPRLDRAVPALGASARIVRRPVGEGEPLPAHPRRAALGRVWRNEPNLGHERAPLTAELDKVVAVGAVAVQEHNQLAGSAGGRRDSRPVQGGAHAYSRSGDDAGLAYRELSARAIPERALTPR